MMSAAAAPDKVASKTIARSTGGTCMEQPTRLEHKRRPSWWSIILGSGMPPQRNAVEKDRSRVIERGDVRDGIAAHQQQIGPFAERDLAEVRLLSGEKPRVLVGGGAQSLAGRHSGLDQIAQLEMQARARKVPEVWRVTTGEHDDTGTTELCDIAPARLVSIDHRAQNRLDGLAIEGR